MVDMGQKKKTRSAEVNHLTFMFPADEFIAQGTFNIENQLFKNITQGTR